MNVPVLALAGLLAILAPQTRTEFVDAVTDGKGRTAVEVLSVPRSLDEIVHLLEQKSAECLDVRVEGTAGTGAESGFAEYHPTLERLDPESVEFTLQVEHDPQNVRSPLPPGGIYLMAADLFALGEARTDVVVYRWTPGLKQVAASFRDWVSGVDAPCPALRSR
jgi:hypothetical protein